VRLRSRCRERGATKITLSQLLHIKCVTEQFSVWLRTVREKFQISSQGKSGNFIFKLEWEPYMHVDTTAQVFKSFCASCTVYDAVRLMITLGAAVATRCAVIRYTESDMPRGMRARPDGLF